jgi:magnesium transporter
MAQQVEPEGKMASESKLGVLQNIVRNYFADDDVAAAHEIEKLSVDDALEVLLDQQTQVSANILRHLPSAFAAQLVAKAAPASISPVLNVAGSDTCASIFLTLHNEQRSQMLESLPTKLKEQIQQFLVFPEGSAGRVMRTDYTAFQPVVTVSEVIASLKTDIGKRTPPANIFVIDPERVLVGVISMRDLVTAEGETSLQHVMKQNVLSVQAFDDVHKALTILAGRGFTSLPVIDMQGRLLGVVRATGLLEDAESTAHEDLQKLFGVSKDERAFSSIWFSLRKRLPWLHVNLATAFMAAAVVAFFEDTIAKVTILAVYLPVVAGQGGNAGAQSLAVVMRGIVMREIPERHVKRLIRKECTVGIINGVVVGLVTAGIAWMWQGSAFLGLVIGLAMIVNLAVAGLAGAAIPILMEKCGLDPAQSSSIILTTVTDIIGFFAFLGFAAIFEKQLLLAS